MKIAIVGKMRSGKSFACEYIKEKLDADVFEFSDGVKEVTNILYPSTCKNREALIKVGQHMREMDKDIWVNIVRNKILFSNKSNIIISSIRQQNEYDMLKELGFTFIKIDSDEKVRIERCIAKGDLSYKEHLNSYLENDLNSFKCDYEIENNSSIDEFKNKLDAALYSINKHRVAESKKKDLEQQLAQNELRKLGKHYNSFKGNDAND